MDIFLGIFVFIVGIIMLIKPSIWWRDSDPWESFVNTDPYYYYATRFGGIICTLFGVAILALPLYQ